MARLTWTPTALLLRSMRCRLALTLPLFLPPCLVPNFFPLFFLGGFDILRVAATLVAMVRFHRLSCYVRPMNFNGFEVGRFSDSTLPFLAISQSKNLPGCRNQVALWDLIIKRYQVQGRNIPQYEHHNNAVLAWQSFVFVASWNENDEASWSWNGRSVVPNANCLSCLRARRRVESNNKIPRHPSALQVGWLSTTFHIFFCSFSLRKSWRKTGGGGVGLTGRVGPASRNLAAKARPCDKLSPQPPHFQVWRVSTALLASAQWQSRRRPAAHARATPCVTPAAEKAYSAAVSRVTARQQRPSRVSPVVRWISLSLVDGLFPVGTLTLPTNESDFIFATSLLTIRVSHSHWQSNE